jgi:hypothetical protein
VTVAIPRPAELVDSVERLTTPADRAPSADIEFQPGRAQPSGRWWSGWIPVAGVASAVQVAMVWWSWNHHLLLAYNDSRYHLTVARRLFDGPNPGVSQIGTVWLPLPHVVDAVPALWTAAWHNGLAGAVPSSICAVVTTVCVFRICERIGIGRSAGYVAAVVMMSDVSWTFVCASPLVEPFLVASVSLAVVGLLGWANSKRRYSPGMTVIFCGLPTGMAMLSRYEGWAFAGWAGVLVAGITWHRVGWGPMLWKQVAAFGAVPAIIASWWVIYNWAVFGNPLAFQQGPFSAQVQSAAQARLGLLPAQHHAVTAMAIFGRTLLDIVGGGTLLLAVVGLAVVILCWRGWRRELWLLLAVPGFFVIYSLYTGQIIIQLPQLIPSGTYNTRYVTEVLPFVAVAVAQPLRLIGRTDRTKRRTGMSMPRLGVPMARRAVTAALMVAVSAGAVSGLRSHSLPSSAITVVEASSEQHGGAAGFATAAWLRGHATTGIILVDDVAFPFLPNLGIGLHRIAATFSGAQWAESLRDPSRATWIVTEPGNRMDRVWVALAHRGVFNGMFVPVARFGPYVVYRLDDFYQHPQPRLVPGGPA